MTRNENKKEIVSLLIGVSVIAIAIAFYWYEVRPSRIIKACQEDVGSLVYFRQSEADIQAIERAFSNCLRRSGINQ